MVLLPIATQHASFRGSSLSIAVVVDGAEEAQAQFPCSSDAATTYLVAEKGARYRVLLELVNARARSHRARSSTVLTCALFVDGAKVASRILRSNAKTELRGVFHAPTNSVARFQFSPPVIVAEGGLQEARHLAKLGTIQVRVYLEHFVGFAETTTALRRDMLVKPSVNEKAKKQVFISSTTSLGRIERIPSASISGKTRTSQTIKIQKEPVLVHTLVYKSRDLLEIDGVIRGEDDDKMENPGGKVGGDFDRAVDNRYGDEEEDEDAIQVLSVKQHTGKEVDGSYAWASRPFSETYKGEIIDLDSEEDDMKRIVKTETKM